MLIELASHNDDIDRLLKKGEKRKFILQANSVFDRYFDHSRPNKFPTSQFDADAHFYRALNRFIVDLGEDPRKRLEQILVSKMEDKSIYVYKLFFNFKDEKSVIDRFLPINDVVRMTLLFVKNDVHLLPGSQADLAKILRDFKIAE